MANKITQKHDSIGKVGRWDGTGIGRLVRMVGSQVSRGVVTDGEAIGCR